MGKFLVVLVTLPMVVATVLAVFEEPRVAPLLLVLTVLVGVITIDLWRSDDFV